VQEQLHNLWLDCNQQITCHEFMASEEVDWLRRATLRSLNWVAAQIAERFGLYVHTVTDTEDSGRRRMALTSLVTRHHDIDCKHDVRFVNNVCLTDKMDSGVIFDLFSAEGMWVFLGPRNTNEYGVFGSMLALRAEAQAFPTGTMRYNTTFPASNQSTRVVLAYPTSDVFIHGSLQNALCNDQVMSNEFMIPDERFYRITENLGFNRNDGILNIISSATGQTNRCSSRQTEHQNFLVLRQKPRKGQRQRLFCEHRVRSASFNLLRVAVNLQEIKRSSICVETYRCPFFISGSGGMSVTEMSTFEPPLVLYKIRE